LWYPDQYAWYFGASRRELKRMVKAQPELKTLKAFRQFLITQTDEGNILRQESVSMVPVFFLDIHAEHRILDMCAAPGSKTAQLLEALHLSAGDEKLPTGLVIANDADRERANMLVHRTKTLGSPALLVTHYEAQFFPNIFHPDTHSPLLYDRILCDVPCSGDGTMRKNPELWRSWHLGAGLNIHPLQLLILQRACTLLAPGGRLVYSTCSFNPLEDEAVIAHILHTHPDFELVDCSLQLPSLRRREGMTKWAVCDPETKVWYHQYVDVPPEKRNKFPHSLFPPSNEIIRTSLSRCMRLFPHDQDSGGFFIAVLTKHPSTTIIPSIITTTTTSSINTLDSFSSVVTSTTTTTTSSPSSSSISVSSTTNSSSSTVLSLISSEQLLSVQNENDILVVTDVQSNDPSVFNSSSFSSSQQSKKQKCMYTLLSFMKRFFIYFDNYQFCLIYHSDI
jgi:16S rRNA C967 or C1407 C5-methylase (RsmB/RsmF family)